MQLVWFVINIFFVASAIVMLFAHRGLTEAQRQGAPAARLIRLRRLRTTLQILTALLFVAMATSFLINMKLNG
ncbi:hypothetical protein [Paenibacillus sp. SYP-B4298]|uniref:hypothetical protein n=1 Tax=Paenibacillus sp. SYP-B4298 TaxID=2996034 RepID=UPI0022DE4724|nr:hypothetical protein [Paenibacillus sp. SYP-B4298]